MCGWSRWEGRGITVHLLQEERREWGIWKDVKTEWKIVNEVGTLEACKAQEMLNIWIIHLNARRGGWQLDSQLHPCLPTGQSYHEVYFHEATMSHQLQQQMPHKISSVHHQHPTHTSPLQLFKDAVGEVVGTCTNEQHVLYYNALELMTVYNYSMSKIRRIVR